MHATVQASVRLCMRACGCAGVRTRTPPASKLPVYPVGGASCIGDVIELLVTSYITRLRRVDTL